MVSRALLAALSSCEDLGVVVKRRAEEINRGDIGMDRRMSSFPSQNALQSNPFYAKSPITRRCASLGTSHYSPNIAHNLTMLMTYDVCAMLQTVNHNNRAHVALPLAVSITGIRRRGQANDVA